MEKKTATRLGDGIPDSSGSSRTEPDRAGNSGSFRIVPDRPVSATPTVCLECPRRYESSRLSYPKRVFRVPETLGAGNSGSFRIVPARSGSVRLGAGVRIGPILPVRNRNCRFKQKIWISQQQKCLGHALGIVYAVARDFEAVIVLWLCFSYAQVFFVISKSSARFDSAKMKLEGQYARKLQCAYLKKRALSQLVNDEVEAGVEAGSPPRKLPRFKSFLSESPEGEVGSFMHLFDSPGNRDKRLKVFQAPATHEQPGLWLPTPQAQDLPAILPELWA